MVTACRKIGIKVLTLYSFSAQNWSRPEAEVTALMTLLFDYIKSERDTIMKNEIRLTAIGELDRIPKLSRSALFQLMEESKHNREMTLCLALSYGGKEEIASMTKQVALKAVAGEIDPHTIDVDLVEQNFWSTPLGPVDLMIRTSGELRISNFLLWSAAYSELYFTDKMWPDFDEQVLDEALESYARRHRRFGEICQ